MPIPSPCHFPRRPEIVSSEFVKLMGVNLRFIKLKEFCSWILSVSPTLLSSKLGSIFPNGQRVLHVFWLLFLTYGVLHHKKSACGYLV